MAASPRVARPANEKTPSSLAWARWPGRAAYLNGRCRTLTAAGDCSRARAGAASMSRPPGSLAWRAVAFVAYGAGTEPHRVFAQLREEVGAADEECAVDLLRWQDAVM